MFFGNNKMSDIYYRVFYFNEVKQKAGISDKLFLDESEAHQYARKCNQGSFGNLLFFEAMTDEQAQKRLAEFQLAVAPERDVDLC